MKVPTDTKDVGSEILMQDNRVSSDNEMTLKTGEQSKSTKLVTPVNLQKTTVEEQKDKVASVTEEISVQGTKRYSGAGTYAQPVAATDLTAVKNSYKVMPQTGEKENDKVVLLGLALLSAVGAMVIGKRKRHMN